MAGLNMDALKKAQAQLESKTNGSGNFLYQNKLKEQTLIRLLPPADSMNGVYFLEVTKYWLGEGKGAIQLVSPATFGKPCPIEAELEDAKAYEDPALDELIEMVKKRSEYRMPIILFADLDGEKLDANNPKVLCTGPVLQAAINKIVCHKNFAPDITDREEGFNIEIQKTGAGLNTKYSAIGDRNPSEMDAKFYKEVPDMVAITKKEIKSNALLVAEVRHFLYGEEIPEDLKKESKPKDEEKAAPAVKKSAPKPEAKTTPRPVAKKAVEPEEDEEEEELEDEEEEEEPEEPAPVRRAAPKAAAKPEVKKPAAPAAGSRGKRLLDTLNDDE